MALFLAEDFDDDFADDLPEDFFDAGFADDFLLDFDDEDFAEDFFDDLPAELFEPPPLFAPFFDAFFFAAMD